MSGKSNGGRYSQSRTDTRIGTGVRVDGDVTFTGVLLVDGGVRGSLSCDADTKGTIVVGQSGHVSGAINAPHIVVSGTVSGPSYSSESIEIQSGACLVGDTFYKAIQVHAGGIIEGSLTPRLATDIARLGHEQLDQASPPAAVDERRMPMLDSRQTGRRFWHGYWGGRTLGWMVTLLIVVIAMVSVNQYPMTIDLLLGDVALTSSSSIKEASTPQAVPAESGGSQDSPTHAAGTDVLLVPGPDATKEAVQTLAAGLSGTEQATVVTVQGVNPRKPAGLFSVTAKEPSVLLKKKRQDPSEGTRIEIPEGATKTIPIGKDEVFRVADGRNLMIFYQGRMVAPKNVESGAWMSFVPQTASGAGDND